MVWMTQNGMKLNVKKTQLMLLGNSHNVKELGQIELEIDGTTIVSQDTMNSLGLTIYSTMTWYDHINKISRSFHLSARSLYPLRPLLTENQFFDIFYTCAVSRINYMSILWGAANNCGRYLIEKKMRQAARILLYKNRQDRVRSDMYLRLKWLLPYDLYLYNLMCFVYTNIHNINPCPYFSNVFTSFCQVHSHETKQGRTRTFMYPIFEHTTMVNDAFRMRLQRNRTVNQQKLKLLHHSGFLNLKFIYYLVFKLKYLI
jgi:hypothetical protein